MKALLPGLCIMLGMFTAIPVKETEWTEENRRFALALLPAAGFLCGLASLLWLLIAGAMGLPALLTGAGLFLIPLFLTGGVHLDGFADTADAAACWGDREKRRQVLKDPHTGAFAVIRVCSLLILYFALLSTPVPESVFLRGLALTGILMLGRAFAALTLLLTPKASDTGLGAAFSLPAEGKISCLLLLLQSALAAAFLLAADLGAGVFALLAGILAAYLCRRRALRLFGGFSGDPAGSTVCIAEAAMLSVFTLFTYLPL